MQSVQCGFPAKAEGLYQTAGNNQKLSADITWVQPLAESLLRFLPGRGTVPLPAEVQPSYPSYSKASKALRVKI